MATLTQLLEGFTASSKELTVNGFVAVIVIVAGVFLGKLVKLVLGRVASRLRLEKIFKYDMIQTALTIIKWAIYLFFASFALELLALPYLSSSFADALSLIPKSVGALIVLVIGFFLGRFFQRAIIQTGKKEWAALGHVCFYFFLYLSFVIALQIVFANNTWLLNWTTILLTFFFLLSMTLMHALQKK